MQQAQLIDHPVFRTVGRPSSLWQIPDPVLLRVLTPRENEIAFLVATGASNKEIARELALSIKTVKNVLTGIFVKTETRSRSELAVRLLRLAHRSMTDTVAPRRCLCAGCSLRDLGCPRG